MKYLGIDYGSKRIGLATSTDDGAMAFPYKVLEVKGRDAQELVEEIMEVCIKENIQSVVVGESKDFKGKDNAIMASIKEFMKEFRATCDIPITTYPEFMTSQQAAFFQGEHAKIDASAAAIILQSFLDAHKLS